MINQIIVFIFSICLIEIIQYSKIFFSVINILKYFNKIFRIIISTKISDNWKEKVLLCKRAIEPRKGFWTIPAGFLELNETTAQGAAREVWEEACAETNVTGLIGIYEIPRISQIYVVHLAEMTNPNFAPGTESEEVTLCSFNEIPWEELAFSSVQWALDQYRENNFPAFGVHPC